MQHATCAKKCHRIQSYLFCVIYFSLTTTAPFLCSHISRIKTIPGEAYKGICLKCTSLHNAKLSLCESPDDGDVPSIAVAGRGEGGKGGSGGVIEASSYDNATSVMSDITMGTDDFPPSTLSTAASSSSRGGDDRAALGKIDEEQEAVSPEPTTQMDYGVVMMSYLKRRILRRGDGAPPFMPLLDDDPSENVSKESELALPAAVRREMSDHAHELDFPDDGNDQQVRRRGGIGASPTVTPISSPERRVKNSNTLTRLQEMGVDTEQVELGSDGHEADLGIGTRSEQRLAMF